MSTIRIHPAAGTMTKLRAEARRRDTTESGLVSAIVRIVLNQGLLDAVLDGAKVDAGATRTNRDGWTPERLEKLKELRAEGMTAEQIAATLSAEEAHILRHSLGVPDPGQTNMYRNHFVTGEGSLDHPHCMALVGKGLMWRRPGNELTGDMDLFGVTEGGKAAVRAILERQTQ